MEFSTVDNWPTNVSILVNSRLLAYRWQEGWHVGGGGGKGGSAADSDT